MCVYLYEQQSSHVSLDGQHFTYCTLTKIIQSSFLLLDVYAKCMEKVTGTMRLITLCPQHIMMFFLIV